jgi:hypothetical protein
MLANIVAGMAGDIKAIAEMARKGAGRQAPGLCFKVKSDKFFLV